AVGRLRPLGRLHLERSFRPQRGLRAVRERADDDLVDAGRKPVRRALMAPPALWRRFAARHLYDYNRPATALWLALVAIGATVLIWSLLRIEKLGADSLRDVLVGIAVAGATAFFPVHIPRSKYSIAVADVFVFSLLWLHGVPAAVAAIRRGHV